METVGIYLRTLRTNKKLSLNDVCKNTGLTTTRLNRIELDEVKEPSPEVLKKLAEFYNVDLMNLYVLAGYLNRADISAGCIPFKNYEILDADECGYIQKTIDFFIEKNHTTKRGEKIWNID